MIVFYSLFKADERCLFLYVHHNNDDFQMFFPSEILRKRFYELIMEMTANPDLDTAIDDSEAVEVGYFMFLKVYIVIIITISIMLRKTHYRAKYNKQNIFYILQSNKYKK